MFSFRSHSHWLAALLLVSGSLAAAEEIHPRVAILADKSMVAYTDLLTSALSSKLELVERQEIQKILQEHQINLTLAKSGDAIELAKLLHADGLLFVSSAILDGSPSCVTRLVSKSGVVLFASHVPSPIGNPDQWVDSISKRTEAAAAKLSVKPEDAVLLSIVNLTSSAELPGIESQLRALLTIRLAEQPELFVLERSRVEELLQEEALSPASGSLPPLASSSRMLSGYITNKSGRSQEVTASFTLTTPKTGRSQKFDIAGDRRNLSEFADRTRDGVVNALGKHQRSEKEERDPKLEAEALLAQAYGARAAGDYAYAEQAVLASRAIGGDSPAVLDAYLEVLLSWQSAGHQDHFILHEFGPQSRVRRDWNIRNGFDLSSRILDACEDQLRQLAKATPISRERFAKAEGPNAIFWSAFPAFIAMSRGEANAYSAETQELRSRLGKLVRAIAEQKDLMQDPSLAGAISLTVPFWARDRNEVGAELMKSVPILGQVEEENARLQNALLVGCLASRYLGEEVQAGYLDVAAKLKVSQKPSEQLLGLGLEFLLAKSDASRIAASNEVYERFSQMQKDPKTAGLPRNTAALVEALETDNAVKMKFYLLTKQANLLESGQAIASQSVQFADEPSPADSAWALDPSAPPGIRSSRWWDAKLFGATFDEYRRLSFKAAVIEQNTAWILCHGYQTEDYKTPTGILLRINLDTLETESWLVPRLGSSGSLGGNYSLLTNSGKIYILYTVDQQSPGMKRGSGMSIFDIADKSWKHQRIIEFVMTPLFIRNKIFLASSSDLQSYDIQSGQWESLASTRRHPPQSPLDNPNYELSGVSESDGRLWVFYRLRDALPAPESYFFDIANRKWIPTKDYSPQNSSYWDYMPEQGAFVERTDAGVKRAIPFQVRVPQRKPAPGEPPEPLPSGVTRSVLFPEGLLVLQESPLGFTFVPQRALDEALTGKPVGIAPPAQPPKLTTNSEQIQPIDAALLAAVQTNEIPVVEKLLEQGANVDAIDAKGWSPLVHAIQLRSKGMVKTLLDRGADINLCTHAGSSPICFATETRDKDLMLQLIKAGAEISLASPKQNTPILIAAVNGFTEGIDFLVQQGARVDEVFLEGDTALTFIAKSEQEASARALIKNGANVNYRQKHGHTPLIYAAYNGRKETVAALLAAGADPTCTAFDIVRPEFKYSAADVATQQGHDELAALLRKAEEEWTRRKSP